MKILVAGATGSIGRLVVKEALVQGHNVRALLRAESKRSLLPPNIEIVIGDVTRPETISERFGFPDVI